MHNAGSAPRPSQRAQRPCGCITTRAPPRVACVSGLGRTRAAPAHPRTHERCQPAESPPTALAEGRVWPQHLDVEQSGRRPWHRQALSMRVGAERHRGACAMAACSYARRAARARWCSCAVCAVPAAHGEAVLPQGPSIFCSTRQPRRRCSRRAATSDGSVNTGEIHRDEATPDRRGGHRVGGGGSGQARQRHVRRRPGPPSARRRRRRRSTRARAAGSAAAPDDGDEQQGHDEAKTNSSSR